MKPAPFEYYAPLELQETLNLLDRYGDEAKILAGGQSLMPLINLRLARPGVIIDINRLRNLDAISTAPDGGLTIGALARQRTLERSTIIQEQNPMLAAAMPLIGHFQIRNRGTIGGSLVHADPAAELPAVSLLLGGEFLLSSNSGARLVAAADFFLGYLATACRPGELLTEIRCPNGARARPGPSSRSHGERVISRSLESPCGLDWTGQVLYKMRASLCSAWVASPKGWNTAKRS
jgi:CO/xanthine dehydrogenase FAD-binding subunit